MDTGKTIKEVREINRAGVQASAGPKKLDIDRKSQEPAVSAYNTVSSLGVSYAKWGRNNKYPQEVVDLNIQDTTSSACLNFKIKAHCGKGLYLYLSLIHI